jgi:hypothetical protein
MVTATAPASNAAATLPLPSFPLPERAESRAGRQSGTLKARPIPVAAWPAGVPRWVTYGGRRRRVVSINEQPPLDPRLAPSPAGTRRIEVELAGGRVLTLLHDERGWYA